jgi:hypothetical protein
MYALLFLTLQDDGMITIGLEKLPINPEQSMFNKEGVQHGPNELREIDDMDIHNYYHSPYSGSLYFGSNKQPINVVFDTGSAVRSLEVNDISGSGFKHKNALPVEVPYTDSIPKLHQPIRI